MRKSHKIQTKKQQLLFRGAPLDAGTCPAFFYFATRAEDSLAVDPFCQAVDPLDTGEIRVFSITLPYHETSDPKEAMWRWAKELSEENDFITPFVEESANSIRELTAQGLIDPSRLVLGGLSRGALVAGHLAMRMETLAGYIGFAPLTSILHAASFLQMKESALARELSLISHKEKLAKYTIRYYMGNRDEMASTTHCFELISALAEEAFNQGVRSPPIELHIAPSIGYKGHGTAPATFLSGANWVRGKLI